jgi:hypothetical protein
LGTNFPECTLLLPNCQYWCFSHTLIILQVCQLLVPCLRFHLIHFSMLFGIVTFTKVLSSHCALLSPATTTYSPILFISWILFMLPVGLRNHRTRYGSHLFLVIGLWNSIILMTSVFCCQISRNYMLML